MPIVAFNITKILAQKIQEKPKPPINIKNNTSITNIQQLQTPTQNNKKLLKFNFTFSTKYEKHIGEITINGNVIYLDQEKNIKQILDTWKKNKTINKELMSQILNLILTKCNIRALSLSEEIALPPPINLPIVRPKQEEKYIG